MHQFLRTDAVEKGFILTLIQNFALCYPGVHFILRNDNKVIADYPRASTDEQRLEIVLGKKFLDNAVPISKDGKGLSLTGFIGLPSFVHSTTSKQYIFVNGRAVKDKQIYACIKPAYANIMTGGGHPALVLHLKIDPYEIDVNVHPSKAEVRFRDSYSVKSFVISTIRERLRNLREKHQVI